MSRNMCKLCHKLRNAKKGLGQTFTWLNEAWYIDVKFWWLLNNYDGLLYNLWPTRPRGPRWWKVLVLLSASVERFYVFRMLDFSFTYWQSETILFILLRSHSQTDLLKANSFVQSDFFNWNFEQRIVLKMVYKQVKSLKLSQIASKS